MNYSVEVAEAANVSVDLTDVLNISAGSVLVDTRVALPDVEQANVFEAELASDSKIFSEAFVDKYGNVSVENITTIIMASPPPPATHAPPDGDTDGSDDDPVYTAVIISVGTVMCIGLLISSWLVAFFYVYTTRADDASSTLGRKSQEISPIQINRPMMAKSLAMSSSFGKETKEPMRKCSLLDESYVSSSDDESCDDEGNDERAPARSFMNPTFSTDLGQNKPYT
eukprot:gene11969-14141_t